MRILDEVSDKALNRVTLYLTLSEARELRDAIESLLATPENHHQHISSADFKKEITVTIYDSQPIESFDERSRRLIRNDT